MSEVFISYARSTEAQARRIDDALRALGYDVWRDDRLPAHRAYSEVLDERLKSARAVVVLWSADAVKSQWVQSEADRARTDGKLVQLTLDGAPLPMPFDRIQCADLAGWTGEPAHEGWKKVLASVTELAGQAAAASAQAPHSPLSPPSPVPQPFTLPEKPSIAVLPFADPAGAEEGDYFADGMVEEIVTALAKYADLFVTGSNSSLSFRGQERDVAGIGRQLGVRYLLQGSIRRSGQRVRITANLVEAADGVQIWSDRFEGGLEDVFALQDEVANAVAARVEPSLQTADLRRGADRPTADQSAYDLYLRARRHMQSFDKPGWRAAKPLLQEAVARDPAYARAWATLAYGETSSALWSWSDDSEAALRDAREALRHATALGAGDAEVLALHATTSLFLGGDARTSEAMAERALAMNPGSVLIGSVAGTMNLFAGHPEQAIERLQHVLRLDPRSKDRAPAILGLGLALTATERFDEALPWLEEALALSPGIPATLFALVDAYVRVGRADDARAMLARAEQMVPAKQWVAGGHDGPIGSRAFAARQAESFRALGADV
jgi:adenylate cyclase